MTIIHAIVSPGGFLVIVKGTRSRSMNVACGPSLLPRESGITGIVLITKGVCSCS